jgi:BTB/POZ domain
MINKGTFSDLVLRLNKDDHLKAHKCILSARSVVFDELLEKNNLNTSTAGILEFTFESL